MSTPAGQQAPPDQRSLGEIVSAVTDDLGTLLKQELELAKTELKQEAAQAGKGAGMLGGAGVASLMLLTFASLALVFVLDNWLPAEAAAALTALLWAVIAAVLAKAGQRTLKSANPQLPKTQQTLKGDPS